MHAEEKSLIEQSAIAERNLDDILHAKYNVVANYLVLGLLFKENRDNGLFKLLGHDSFEDFLGTPEVGFSRSKAYQLIHIRELYKDKLGVDDKMLLEIGNAKLALIAPVVESDKDGWLGKARELSKSDLRVSIAEAGGKFLSPPTSPPRPSSLSLPMDCINGCGPGERSHFPITRGAGADDSWWVPMCRDCHEEFHRGAETFIEKYKRNWARYYYTHMNRD